MIRPALALCLVCACAPACAQDAGDRAVGVDLGLDARLRYEFVDPTAFGRGPQDRDGFLLWRVSPTLRWRLDAHWRIEAQVSAAGELGRNGGARPADRNDLDLTQAFVEWRSGRGGDIRVRAGRQEIALGSGRLLAASDGANVRRRFDGALGEWRREPWTLIAVAAAPVRVAPGSFDDRRVDGAWLAGIGAIRTRPQGSAGAYLLRTRRTDAAFGSGPGARTTLGARWQHRSETGSVEIEALLQRGQAASRQIRGWAVAGDTRTTLARIGRARLRAGLSASVASGDRDPADGRIEGFDPLFPNPVYTGSFPLIGPANLAAIDPGLALEWSDGARLGLDVALMRRLTSRDAVYAFSGQPIALDGDDRNVGALWALSGRLPLSEHLSLDATLAHLQGGKGFGPERRNVDAAFVNLSLRY
jgi:hypothetical protein